MASPHQLVMSEVKIEIDVAEEPEPAWRSQHHCSGTTSDWSENSVSTTITPCETNSWNPSAAIMKSEPDRQPASGQVIKAEPVDHSVTSGMFHQFQSVDNREGKVDIKWESSTCADLSSSPLDPWNVVKSENSKPEVWNNRSEMNFDCRTESLRANISSNDIKTEVVSSNISSNDIKTEVVSTNISSDDIKTEVVSTNTSSDVQTEAVTDIMMTVTCDAVRSESVASRDEGKNRPAGDVQKEGNSIRTTPQTSGNNRTSLHKSVNTCGSLLPQNRSHVCQHCSAAFVLFNNLKGHMASVHGEKLQDVLPVSSTPDGCGGDSCTNKDIEKKAGNCGDRKTVERKKDKVNDNETDGTGLEKDSRRHVCDVCSKAFTQAGALKTHKLIHAGLKQFVCDVCRKAFTQAGDLKKHKLIHTGNKQFVCDVCSRAFTQAGDLKKHKLIHSGLKQFVCDVCSRAFIRADNLKTHKLIHTDHKQFVCDVCSKAFVRADHLKTHKLIHTGHKQFVCDVCSKAFIRAGDLKTHKFIHTGHKQFVCDVCGKTFAQAGLLNKHKLIHAGQFVCDVCSWAFTQARSLKRHKLVHVGDTPYVCDSCGAPFSRNSDLEKHHRIHTVDKPFVCTDCGKSFACSSELKKHDLKKHTGAVHYRYI